MKTNISLRKLSPGILSCVLISLSDITLVLAVPPPPPPPPVYVANTPDHSVPVAAQSIIEYRYVGVTEGSSTGKVESSGLVGFAAMNALCAAEFGSAARVATTIEATNFSTATNTFNSFAWVQPTPPVRTFTSPISSGLGYISSDAIGALLSTIDDDEVDAVAKASCYGYSREDGRGPVVGTTGYITTSPCNSLQPIACSAPVILNAKDLTQ